MTDTRWPVRFVFTTAILLSCLVAPASADDMLGKGDEAKDFALQAVAGELNGDVKLSELKGSGPIVLVVLRGFPGYQCPICSRQVGALVAKADEFKKQNAKVLMVYPGPGSGLEGKAKQFLRGGKLPAPFTLLLDPDYEFTNAYGLRWKAPRETAYPSTFVLDGKGTVTFAKVSKTHGGRTRPDEVLQAVGAAAK
ncbi:MAG: peroxiredoxin family protein [Planctomycetota bacterium]